MTHQTYDNISVRLNLLALRATRWQQKGPMLEALYGPAWRSVADDAAALLLESGTIVRSGETVVICATQSDPWSSTLAVFEDESLVGLYRFDGHTAAHRIQAGTLSGIGSLGDVVTEPDWVRVSDLGVTFVKDERWVAVDHSGSMVIASAMSDPGATWVHSGETLGDEESDAVYSLVTQDLEGIGRVAIGWRRGGEALDLSGRHAIHMIPWRRLSGAMALG